MRLIDDYISDSGIADDLRIGASLLTVIYHQQFWQTLASFVPKDKPTTWYTLDTKMVVGPLACIIHPVFDTTVDLLDLTADKLCYFGGYLLGDFTTLDLPVVDTLQDPAGGDTLIGDMLATSLGMILKGVHTLAFMVLQAVFMMLQLYEGSVLEFTTSPAGPIQLEPFSLS